MESLRHQLADALNRGTLSFLDSGSVSRTSGEHSIPVPGSGERLEQLGEKLIRRPSSLAIWKRTQPSSRWDQADATYIPQQGWKFRGKRFEDWIADLGAFKLKLVPQENGQTGLFPEHLAYFETLSQELERLKSRLGRPVRVLNLFAYTGMATVWCTLHHAEVTHIELSKRILTWARENLALNGTFETQTRFIPEDALTFLEREIRRNSHYDLIISDPPSFSRITKGESWDLENVITSHIHALTRVLNPGGAIFLTSHHQLLNIYTLENLFQDIASPERAFSFEPRELILSGPDGKRRLACGSLLIARQEHA